MHLPFVDQLPWKTFGRKNVGYLYAISMGAKIIFDFDDDNLLKFWLKEASPDPALDIDNYGPKGGLCKYTIFLTNMKVLQVARSK